jgi:hypothetical protein
MILSVVAYRKRASLKFFLTRNEPLSSMDTEVDHVTNIPVLNFTKEGALCANELRLQPARRPRAASRQQFKDFDEVHIDQSVSGQEPRRVGKCRANVTEQPSPISDTNFGDALTYRTHQLSIKDRNPRDPLWAE